MYTNTQYISFNGVVTGISCDINNIAGFIPIDSTNTDYKNIMTLVEAGTLTITPAPTANTGS